MDDHYLGRLHTVATQSLPPVESFHPSTNPEAIRADQLAVIWGYLPWIVTRGYQRRD